MDKMFVALIDLGSIKHFDSRIWYDSQKANEYYEHMFRSSDVKWVILNVGESVPADDGGPYKCDWEKCPGVHPNHFNYCSMLTRSGL